jgi:hypothetical protein
MANKCFGGASWFGSSSPDLVKFGHYNLDVEKAGRGWAITAWRYYGPKDARFKVEALVRTMRTLADAQRLTQDWAKPDDAFCEPGKGRIYVHEIEKALDEAMLRAAARRA